MLELHRLHQQQLSQLTQNQDDLENRLRCSNLQFISLTEGIEGSDQAYFLENLLLSTYSRAMVKRAHYMMARQLPLEVPPLTFIVTLFSCRDVVFHLSRENGNIPF